MFALSVLFIGLPGVSVHDLLRPAAATATSSETKPCDQRRRSVFRDRRIQPYRPVIIRILPLHVGPAVSLRASGDRIDPAVCQVVCWHPPATCILP